MNKFLFLAPFLVAGSSFEKAAELFSSKAPAASAALTAAPARPAVAKSLKRLNGTRATATVTDVVNAANAFIATLSTAQQATLLQAYNSTNVTKWSNLPCGSTYRIGLRLDALTAAQQTAALAVVQAATGTVAGDGFNEIQQLRAADDNLAANGGGSGLWQRHLLHCLPGHAFAHRHLAAAVWRPPPGHQHHLRQWAGNRGHAQV